MEGIRVNSGRPFGKLVILMRELRELELGREVDRLREYGT